MKLVFIIVAGATVAVIFERLQMPVGIYVTGVVIGMLGYDM